MESKILSSILIVSFVLTSVVADDDNTKSETPNDTANNIKLGFGLTAVAAGASMIGSTIPFLDLVFPYIPGWEGFRITQSKGFLAGSLAFSAGLLTFLTINDLFSNAVDSFNNSNAFDSKYSNIVATSIFSGVILLLILTKIVISRLKGKFGKRNKNDGEVDIGDKEKSNDEQITKIHLDAHQLKILGIQVAIALAIHNIPEGLANFVTTVTNAKVGILFAIALAFHKVPEGLIISLPIYYATGSRWIAFIISGGMVAMTQFIGALIGYALAENTWNGVISGCIISAVVGFLLYVIFHSMFPLARRYDPEDKYCTYCTCGGFFFVAMVASLLSISGVDA
ncbi:9114_t:CDS:2 [Acaulospora morrowiae]|uniref:9114_t:CDS:1 n=1 Tax=Acaulospora morrowiae TaxID=94023 RepID=A0A9N8ZTN1_9GLOM|nr:9114_t:CDS:2 [Acaulospora morrowiae]